MPLLNRLISTVGSGVGMVAEYSEQRRATQARQYTPSASEAGDAPTQNAPAQHTPISAPLTHDVPPTYAESVDLGSDRQVATGSRVTGDNKVQLDDNLRGEDSSEDLEDDDSDITLSALVDEDEAAWVLDEYAATHEPPSYEDATNVPSEDDLVQEIIAGQRAHELQQSAGTLPCPVILPQRRPRNRARGFVRAYAPVLQNVGIDQATFLKFLYNFHKSSQASPWFTVIEVSSVAARAAGPAIGFAVEAAVKAATTAGRNLETAYKTNNFLDRMNKELFEPAGTLAFLMKYKTDPKMTADDAGLFGVVAANVNLLTNQVVAKYDREGSVAGGVDSLLNKMQMFRIASETVEGADNLPESAPLIFPEFDAEVARRGSASLKDKASDTQAFVQDYLDRRSQIKFAREDPTNSALAPPVEMKSKLADPDHPMFNTGVVGLLTGGYIDLQGMVKDRHQARRDRRAARDGHRQERREQRHEKKLERHQRRLERGVRRFERRYGKSPSTSSLSASSAVEPPPASAPTSAKGEGSGRRRRKHHRKGGVRGTVSKLMTEDVLYLMIVNLPQEEEHTTAEAA